MIIIEEVLVDSAISIRNKFESLRLELVGYEKNALELSTYLLKVSDDLEKYVKDDIKNASSVNESTKYILDKMLEMEQESERISKLIDPINVSIEKLKKDEMELYLEIKKRNPNQSDSDLIKSLNEKMKKSDT
jgi:hypothetical protein